MLHDCLTPEPISRAAAHAAATALPPGAAARAAAMGAASAAQAGETPDLGKNAKSVRQLPSDGYQDRRAAKFKHQRAAAKLLPSERVSNCLWAVTDRFYGVDVVHNCIEQRARLNGVQTCGSVWICPVCSATVSELRRRELNALLHWGRESGYHPVMLTLTARHARDDDLGEQLNGMKKAKQRLARHRAYAELRPSLVGHVTATELTGGGANGWHVHFHQILLLRADNEADAIQKMEALRAPWLASLNAEKLTGTDAAFQVQGATAAGNYVTKWGAAEELALGGKKSGRAGRTPFQLLAAFADGEERAGMLFAEFARHFKGRRQLVWSPGLKRLANIDEVTDEQAAEEEALRAEAASADEVLRNYTPNEWRKVRPHRSELLRLAELQGASGVAAIERIALPCPTGVMAAGHVSEAKRNGNNGPPPSTDASRVAMPSSSNALHCAPC